MFVLVVSVIQHHYKKGLFPCLYQIFITTLNLLFQLLTLHRVDLRVKIEVERCSERMIQEFLELIIPITFSQQNVI